MKLFPTIIRRTTVVGGGGAGLTDTFRLGIKAAEAASPTPTETTHLAVAMFQAEANPTPTELARAGLSGSGLSDTNIVPADAQSGAIRVWADGCTDNDASKTTPANANGGNNGTVATVRTALSLGDLTNPVVLSTSSYNQAPTSGTYTSKLLRIYFDILARTTAFDTITIKRTTAATGTVTIYPHVGTAAVNHSTGTFTHDVSALTLADLQTLVVDFSYAASVVATPEAAIRVDAVALELVGTL